MQVFFLTTPNPTTLEQVPLAAANIQNCCGTLHSHSIFSLAWEMHWKSLLDIPFYLLPCSYACVWPFTLLILSLPHTDWKIWLLGLYSDLSCCFRFSQLWLIQLLPWDLLCCSYLSALGLHLLLVKVPRHCSQILAYSLLRSIDATLAATYQLSWYVFQLIINSTGFIKSDESAGS